MFSLSEYESEKTNGGAEVLLRSKSHYTVEPRVVKSRAQAINVSAVRPLPTKPHA